jgi:beta-glucosidase
VLGSSWHDRHQALLQAAGRRAAQLLVIGDGLADGWHRSRAFQKQWRERKPLNLALPGDQTQQLVWRIEHGALDGLTPRLVLVVAGSENLAHGFTPAQTARGVAAVLQRVRERLPDSRVLLLGLLPAGQSALDPLRAASDATNVELRAVASAAQLTLAEPGGVFLEPDGRITPGMLGDDGQPTALGYEALTITVSLLAQRLLEAGH